MRSRSRRRADTTCWCCARKHNADSLRRCAYRSNVLVLCPKTQRSDRAEAGQLSIENHSDPAAAHPADRDTGIQVVRELRRHGSRFARSSGAPGIVATRFGRGFEEPSDPLSPLWRRRSARSPRSTVPIRRHASPPPHGVGNGRRDLPADLGRRKCSRHVRALANRIPKIGAHVLRCKQAIASCGHGCGHRAVQTAVERVRIAGDCLKMLPQLGKPVIELLLQFGGVCGGRLERDNDLAVTDVSAWCHRPPRTRSAPERVASPVTGIEYRTSTAGT